MMCLKNSTIKGLATLEQRVQDLRKDGYHVLFHYESKELHMYKLRHHNGNRIVLKLTFNDGILSQRTNHILTHYEKVC